MPEQLQPKACPISGCTNSQRIFIYDQPPEGEVKLERLNNSEYYREIWQFEASRHYVSIHRMNLAGLYEGEYNQSNYTDLKGMRRTFEKITSFPPQKSDNKGRVVNIHNFWCKSQTFDPNNPPKVLDIGSGLAVFPFEMKELGWDATALDPDPAAIEHAKAVAGVHGVCGTLNTTRLHGKFDLITLNKVAEHVEDPIAMLKECIGYLQDNGILYVEVPDGEMASKVGKEREEFFIDHFHMFSFTSLALLGEKAGLVPVHIERLQEPSTKYTLRAFFRLP